MASRFFKWTIVVIALLVCFPYGSVWAQAPQEATDSAASLTAGSELNPIPTVDLLVIQRRLQEQDEEIRQLRDQLGTLQNAVQAPQATVTDSLLPVPSSSILQTGATMGAPASPAVFELQERLAALEKRVEMDAASAEPKTYEVGSDLKMSASWRNGLQIQSANKDFRVHVGGVTQFDTALFDNDPALLRGTSFGGIGPGSVTSSQPDSLDIRRLRLRVDGTMYEVVDWVVQVDFANFVTPSGTVSVQSPASTNPSFNEIYINWGQLPVLGNFKAGNFKEPIGFEHLQTDSLTPFMERSYLQDFVFGPFNGGYTPGFDFYNWNEDQSMTWAIGLFGNNSDNFGFSLGNDYAGTARLTWCPYYDGPTDGRYVMHFGASGSVRGADENLDRLRVRGDIRSGPPGILNPIYADTGSMGASLQDIVSTEMAFVVGSFSVVGEWCGTWIEQAVQPLTPVPVARGTPFFQGGYIQCGYFLTGEHEVYNRQRATFDRVIPYENAFCVRTCDGTCKGCGAWQVLARYNAVNLNADGINGGSLDSFTFGVNWIWNPNCRMVLNYDFTSRGPVKQVPAGDIQALGIRFSYDY